MRMDKLTTQFQQALQDAQSLAVGRDNQYIEPVHLMSALLEQQGGSVQGHPHEGRREHEPAALAARRGARSPADRRGHARRGPPLERSRQAAERRRQARAGARQRVCPRRSVPARSRAIEDGSRPHSREGWRGQGRDREGDRGGRRRQGRRPERRGEAPGAREIHDRPHGARGAGEARPGDRPRRRDPPHDPGAPAAHEEQSGADRRARRRQDRDRRRPRAADRERSSSGGAEGQARAVARHGRADRGREVPRRVRGAPEGRAERPREAGRPGHPVHRRAAHDGRRRQGRGLDGRRATC